MFTHILPSHVVDCTQQRVFICEMVLFRMLTTSSTQVAELAHALASAKSPQKTYLSTLATDGGGGSAMSAEVEKLREELEEAKTKLDEEKFSHSQTRQASQQHAVVRLMLLPLSRPFLSPTCLELFFVFIPFPSKLE